MDYAVCGRRKAATSVYIVYFSCASADLLHD